MRTSNDRCVNPVCGGYATRWRSLTGYCRSCVSRRQDRPEPYKQYALTDAGPSTANGNTWAESEVCGGCSHPLHAARACETKPLFTREDSCYCTVGGR